MFSVFKKVVFSVLTILWMMVIFWFSAAPADASADMSITTGKRIAQVLNSDYKTWTKEKQEEYAERIDYFVRKSAHFCEYAILGMLLYLTVLSYSVRRKWLTAWGIAVIYAASDEIHQLFVTGRSGQITDVILDSTGAITGVIIVIFGIWLIRRIFKKDLDIYQKTY